MGKDIKEYSLEDLRRLLGEWGDPAYRAAQIFSWIYRRGAGDFDAMTDLSSGLRKKLKAEFFVRGSLVKELRGSSDGTKKLLIELADRNLIEGVSIPAEGRVTGCISSQAGCRFACRFCASGLGGFVRDLTAGEILDEVLLLKGVAREALTHIVFMGIGEPLDNYVHVLKSIRIINSPDGFNIGARRITVSTSGIVPGIERLAKEDLQLELSVSLHATDDAVRSALMPVNKKYPLKELLKALKGYIRTTDRQVTFEYALIDGVNSDLKNARQLATIVKGLGLCKVNLIPANVIPELRVGPPNKPAILLFKDALTKAGVVATLRKSRGRDIEAACGQLRLSYEKK